MRDPEFWSILFELFSAILRGILGFFYVVLCVVTVLLVIVLIMLLGWVCHTCVG